MATLSERLPELAQLEQLINRGQRWLKVEELASVADPLSDAHLPIHALTLGSDGPSQPSLVLVGGIHGLERIGTQVVLAWLQSLLGRIDWDLSLEPLLQGMRIVLLPLINPAGMAAGRRANGNGIDLMRNAPVDSQEPTAWLVGGHRLSRHLPWYRGPAGSPMQVEAQALCSKLEQLTAASPCTLVLDCHSGFGLHDRLWFPYARSRWRPVAHLAELFRLRLLLQHSHPHHDYRFEPQARHYTCHGDLWDYLYDRAVARHQLLLPLTLEMGSWRWVKKAPLQLRHAIGLFHPIQPHRTQRVLRRHLLLIDLLLRATYSWQYWTGEDQRPAWEEQARALWYD
ncbi:MAG: DUF2817 domain-containing protein [Gammaproteobacteria bacterium]|nr:DUF2817 domain-containing protein [Gammaproteobacteria bacterium]